MNSRINVVIIEYLLQKNCRVFKKFSLNNFLKNVNDITIMIR